jgi:DNA-binding response OmpR family regulator
MEQTHILIIEDDALLSHAIETALIEKGYAVSVAGSSEEGLKKYKEEAPQLLLVDIMIPGKNGLEFVKEICEGGNDVCGRIIMMTSLESQAYLAQALELGVKHYVTKNDTSPKEIVTLVERVLNEDHN